ncbi:MAG: phytanoyl-CoA dioxygenase family protein [Aphanocapsa sp. GSE-SYN-MK-11-07L]|nr:phytanoyl-CoA dioxygenase family protein [Aphanocapsa sp. GSE-SYN-MK-11-07L]
MDREIIRDIQTKGVHLTSLEKLDIASVPDLEQIANQAAHRLVFATSAQVDQKEASGCFAELDPIDLMTQYPEIFRWGLDPRILNIAENCIGLPPAYLGVSFRRSFANQRQVGTHLWHLDAEDYHVVRIIVYLNNVDLAGGAFEYIPRSHRLSYRSFKGIDSIADQQMQRVIPADKWKACPGKAGTVIIANTGQTFHHGKVSVNQERLALIYAYTSRQPKDLELAKTHCPTEKFRECLAEQLSERELSCVYDWR